MKITKAVPRALHAPNAASRLCLLFTGRGRYLTHIGVTHRPRGRRLTTSEWNLEIERILPVPGALALDALTAQMATLHANRLREAVAERYSILPEGAEEETLQSLRAQRPTFISALEWISQPLERILVEGLPGQSWAVQRDAVELALQMGGYPRDLVAMWTRPQDDALPYLAGVVELLESSTYDPTASDWDDGYRITARVADLPRAIEEKPADLVRPHPDDVDDFIASILDRTPEPSLIEHDMRVAPPGMGAESIERRPHTKTFVDDRRRITIMNVNATRVEARLGVDLLYYHWTTQSFVFVQCKTLDYDQVDVDERFQSQMTRMAKLSKLGRDARNPHEWRLGSDFCYHKLAQCRFLNTSSQAMVPGLYLPLSYTRLLLEHDESRNRGEGRTLGYRNVDRYLTNTQFIKLVQEGWIGTTGVSQQDLANTTRVALDEGSNVVLAVDQSSESAKGRQERARSREGGRRRPGHV